MRDSDFPRALFCDTGEELRHPVMFIISSNEIGVFDHSCGLGLDWDEELFKRCATLPSQTTPHPVPTESLDDPIMRNTVLPVMAPGSCVAIDRRIVGPRQ